MANDQTFLIPFGLATRYNIKLSSHRTMFICVWWLNITVLDGLIQYFSGYFKSKMLLNKCFLKWPTFKCQWNKVFVFSFICSIQCLKHAWNHCELYFLEENSVQALLLSLRTLWCHWLLTCRKRYRFSLLFTEFILTSLFFILLLPINFLPHIFCPAVTENTHYRHWREPKS